MDRRRMLAGLIVLAVLAGGCIGQGPPTSRSPGQALTPGPAPTSAACRQLVATDIDAAVRVRTSLAIAGIAATATAAQDAAQDPTADVSALGIPLTAPELATFQASATPSDPSTALRTLVEVGEPRRFGGVWIDPPGTSRYVIGILDSDPAAMGLAQCMSTGLDVRFVAAEQSVAVDEALVARISADLDDLRSSGIPITSVGISVRSSVSVVVIGVNPLTDAIRAQLVSRYGPAIVVEAGTPAGAG